MSFDLCLCAFFRFINHRFLLLPGTIGLLSSGRLIAVGWFALVSGKWPVSLFARAGFNGIRLRDSRKNRPSGGHRHSSAV